MSHYMALKEPQMARVPSLDSLELLIYFCTLVKLYTTVSYATMQNIPLDLL